MKTPADTSKVCISLPGDLARFVEQEMEAEVEPNRSGVIQNALRLMQMLKRQFEAGAGKDVLVGQAAFSREEIVRLFPSWDGGAKGGERSTLNVQLSTLNGGDSTSPASPREPGKRATLRGPATAGLNSELPTPKGGDSTGSSSKGKRSAERNEGVRARVGVSSPIGGSNSEAAPLTRTPALTPLPSEDECFSATAGDVTPSSPLPSIEIRNSKFENPPAQ